MKDNVKYTDIQNILYAVMDNTIRSIEASFHKNDIDNYMKKYQVENLRDLVSILFCSSDTKNNTININLQNHIKEVEKELHILEFDYSLLDSSYKKISDENSYIKDRQTNEIKSLKELTYLYQEKTKQIEKYHKDVKMVLLNNNLNLENEIKKIKLTPNNNNNFPKI